MVFFFFGFLRVAGKLPFEYGFKRRRIQFVAVCKLAVDYFITRKIWFNGFQVLIALVADGCQGLEVTGCKVTGYKFIGCKV